MSTPVVSTPDSAEAEKALKARQKAASETYAKIQAGLGTAVGGFKVVIDQLAIVDSNPNFLKELVDKDGKQKFASKKAFVADLLKPYGNLHADIRQVFSQYLHAEGESLRSIGETLNISKDQVAKDLRVTSRAMAGPATPRERKSTADRLYEQLSAAIPADKEAETIQDLAKFPADKLARLVKELSRVLEVVEKREHSITVDAKVKAAMASKEAEVRAQIEASLAAGPQPVPNHNATGTQSRTGLVNAN